MLVIYKSSYFNRLFFSIKYFLLSHSASKKGRGRQKKLVKIEERVELGYSVVIKIIKQRGDHHRQDVGNSNDTIAGKIMPTHFFRKKENKVKWGTTSAPNRVRLG